MKNKTEVSRTDVCVRVVKGALEGGGGVMAEKLLPSPAAHQHPSSPPLSPSTPPTQTKIKCESPTVKIKCESPTVFLGSHTPPPSGPGAEVKGKPGNPIASGSTRVTALSRPNSAGGEEGKVAGGGRLTFFKEGKFLLELSHRTDMGAPAGWVPVKSKTYWPPPSSTTATTTQHPLRHDTPTSQSVSDDCSSLNSSPWTSDHIRKQSLPRPARGPSAPPLAAPFCFHFPPETRHVRRQLSVGRRRRRNPLLQPPVKELVAKVEGSKVEGEVKKRRKGEIKEGEDAQGKGAARLEKWVQVLCVRGGMRVEPDITLHSLFEQRSSSVGGAGEAVDPTFVSPRKRYLRQMETDQDVPSVLHRKKLHSVGLPQGHGDRGAGVAQVSTSASSSTSSSTSVSALHRTAMNALAPSVYSIDSILNHEGAGSGAGTGTSRRGDSFLRTLLKPEAKPSPARSRERPLDPPPPAPVKAEREQVGSTGTERGDALLDLNRPSPDRYDLSRYSPVAGLYHLAPYVDPRYMMLHSLAPGLVAPTTPQPSEVAQALAAATAAAAAAAAGLGTYPLGPLPPPIPGAQYYYPPTSVAAQLLRPPALPSRCSPHPPASPGPKTQYPPPTPASPHLSRGASPRGRASPWQPPPPPAHPLSPHPSLASPLPSPPPQDAPLNLSKPRNHLGK